MQWARPHTCKLNFLSTMVSTMSNSMPKGKYISNMLTNGAIFSTFKHTDPHTVRGTLRAEPLLSFLFELIGDGKRRSAHLPIQPACKTKTYGDRAFSVCAPKIWNTVPLEIRQSSTVVLFKKKLKTFLFTRFIESNSMSYF